MYNVIVKIKKGASRKELKMKRVEFDKEIKASNIEKATEKFCKILRDNGYEWAADEMTETVSNGYFCCSNAAEHNLKKGEVTSPKTADWSYYWAIEQLDEKNFYAWFIERQ